MYRKYRILLLTTRGRVLAAASDSVNGLADKLYYFLKDTAAGRAVYDDQLRAIALYVFDPATAQYINVGQLPTNSRKDAVAKARELGAR